MGKMRKKCSRVHITAAKVPSTAGVEGSCGNEREYGISLSEIVPMPVDFMEKRSFVPLCHTGTNHEERKLLNDEESGKVKAVTKKDKRKNRHQTWLKKIESIRLAKEATKAAERRKKTVIVGDLQPLYMSLPEVTHADQVKDEVQKKNPIKTCALQRQQTIFQDVDMFKQVLNHPAFVSSPLETISEHIKNVVSVETNK